MTATARSWSTMGLGNYWQQGTVTDWRRFVLGCPPYVAFMGPQKLPVGMDEFLVAGGLAGEPINVVKAKTVDLMVPAEAEIVIEGYIDTTKIGRPFLSIPLAQLMSRTNGYALTNLPSLRFKT